MSTDTNVENLIINTMTKAQFEELESPSNTELYFVEETDTTEYAKDLEVVHKEGTETVSGDKTFTGKVVLNNATALTQDITDNSNAVATTKYVQDVIATLIARIETLEKSINEHNAEITNISSTLDEINGEII